MTKILLIRGRQQSGKTTTLGLLYKKLVTICEAKHLFDNEEVFVDSLKFTENVSTIDFTAILGYMNKKIGLISAGDVPKDVRYDLEIMIKINVDIVICCSRSRNVKGSTHRMILDEFSENNNISLEINTKYSNDIEDKNLIKGEVVDTIWNQINNIIHE